jgi:predicted transcriptional regulator
LGTGRTLADTATARRQPSHLLAGVALAPDRDNKTARSAEADAGLPDAGVVRPDQTVDLIDGRHAPSAELDNTTTSRSSSAA